MEDLSPSDAPPPSDADIPSAGNDPGDPSRREIDEDASPPPIGAPRQDMDATEEKEEMANLSDDPDVNNEAAAGNVEPDAVGNDGADDDIDDAESDLSEIDEAQFDDFDPTNISIVERPVAVDESNVNLLKAQKRKRVEGEEEPLKKKKKKEGRREKSRKRRDDPDDDAFSGGEEIDGKRRRKPKDPVEGQRKDRPRQRRPATPENEDDLTPEERRKRALDKKMDAALKGAPRRAKAGGVDIETANDELIEQMRIRMTDAAKSDTESRASGKPAMAKLKLLPAVLALLSRTAPQLREQLVDPDTNLLEAVRFFLEPLNDGSLPAYTIQHSLFSVLGKLPIGKDALVASGIGKVTLFYTKSTKPEHSVKRMAEKLLGDWTRPILKRSDDYRKRELVEANYDPMALPERLASQSATAPAGLTQALSMAARERKLAAPGKSNRARVESGATSYTVVPRSNVLAAGAGTQRLGAGAEDAIRRIKMRNAGRGGGGLGRR